MTTATAASLAAEYAELHFPRFAEAEAWTLGQKLAELAGAAPVVINIRSTERMLFHAALPGSAPLNDLWARRKSNTALLFQLPSFLVGARNRENGHTLARNGLAEADYADHGGAVPIRVTGVGVVACATVSGLPQADDHALVVAAIQAMLVG
ncbi:heme-degrading domain-containing protein [Cypionkella sp.]|uniref:heme-degrading domain-containing protein n=1 Tax=Cypionkella sp. TaxID=2811411 RepID=UPI00271DCB2E|nr:heme-degrading domain-containing protein [Cypionkella sp.]MDO8983654.1 heme-degrading domain-containing protein [Cypionkella sp.]MDP2050111.1 heme-degrading domain-containing protein [Cypionkella sp.]